LHCQRAATTNQRRRKEKEKKRKKGRSRMEKKKMFGTGNETKNFESKHSKLCF